MISAIAIANTLSGVSAARVALAMVVAMGGRPVLDTNPCHNVPITGLRFQFHHPETPVNPNRRLVLNDLQILFGNLLLSGLRDNAMLPAPPEIQV